MSKVWKVLATTDLKRQKDLLLPKTEEKKGKKEKKERGYKKVRFREGKKGTTSRLFLAPDGRRGGERGDGSGLPLVEKNGLFHYLLFTTRMEKGNKNRHNRKKGKKYPHHPSLFKK